MPFTKDNVAEIIAELEARDWQERLSWLSEQEGNVSFSSSLGLEDQVITDVIANDYLSIRIFTLDTGRLFEETYALLDETMERYKVSIETYHPDPDALAKYVQADGINGFYKSVESRKACCFVRKVEPLTRALKDVNCWVSGLRREHSDHRSDLPIAEWDDAHQLVKCYPLIDVELEEIEAYIVQHKVPYNALHDQGFPSIGCAPCTRAIQPGEPLRAGRWWWEDESAQECGLHMVNGRLVRAN
ncbi:MAG: phosphoadenylyl-sulfate reductase [Rickettsiales bacterium]|nr:phosphoadenylyl-sulfate reductase [Rickettsiales bacterium]